MPKTPSKIPLPASVWILLCAFLNCAGWILSAVHQLNLLGYTVMFALAAAGIVLWGRRKPSAPRGFNLHRLRGRFRRGFPLAFLILAALAILGGVIHPPVNYDALAYRLPRVLNWLADRHWTWIHTEFHRLNTRSCGIEWISAPLIAFTRTDRLLFLINAVSFLLLPGLVFSGLTRVGVKPRVAWYWMWLAPTGYCYLLQAGSIGNDLFGAVFGLAALDLALRARAKRNLPALWLSILAVALLTGAKTSNLPLALPWLVIVFPVLPLLFNRLAVTVAVCLAAIMASFLPMAVLNYKYCGDWTGAAAEKPMMGHNLPLRVAQNVVLLGLENLAPPIFPLAPVWNHKVPALIPPGLKHELSLNFDAGEANYQLPEMQMEESAGLGFGVTVMLLVSVAAGFCWRKSSSSGPPMAPPEQLWRAAILLSPWLSLLVIIAKTNWSISRLSVPYYALLMPALLVGSAQSFLVRRAWWRLLATVMFLFAGLLVVLSPPRPLWPVKTLLSGLDLPESSRLVQRLKTVYSVYAGRHEAFAPLLAALPEDVPVVGLVTFDDPETSLWEPIGKRRIRHVIPGDSATDLHAQGIRYVLVGREKFNQLFHEPFEQWLAKMNGTVIKTLTLRLRAGNEPSDWLIIDLGPSGLPATPNQP